MRLVPHVADPPGLLPSVILPGIVSLTAVQPPYVVAWIEAKARGRSVPIVKQQLAAIRHLVDWLVIGQVVMMNPAASVRGPRHVVRIGRTPVLEPAAALDS